MIIEIGYIAFLRYRNFFNKKIENALQKTFPENYKTEKFDFLIQYCYEEDGLDSIKIIHFNYYTLNEFIEDFYKKQTLELDPDYYDGFLSHVWMILQIGVLKSGSNQKQIF